MVSAIPPVVFLILRDWFFMLLVSLPLFTSCKRSLLFPDLLLCWYSATVVFTSGIANLGYAYGYGFLLQSCVLFFGLTQSCPFHGSAFHKRSWNLKSDLQTIFSDSFISAALASALPLVKGTKTTSLIFSLRCFFSFASASQHWIFFFSCWDSGVQHAAFLYLVVFSSFASCI